MRENLSFLIERREIILIKYYILFLTTCYSQLVFIRDGNGVGQGEAERWGLHSRPEWFCLALSLPHLA